MRMPPNNGWASQNRARYAFLRGSVAVAIPKNRRNALEYVAIFIENAKASGLVRRAFDEASLKQLAVAPPSVQR